MKREALYVIESQGRTIEVLRDEPRSSAIRVGVWETDSFSQGIVSLCEDLPEMFVGWEDFDFDQLCVDAGWGD